MSANARAPDATVRISGLLGRCANISLHKFSQSASSSKTRILWRISIPMALIANAAAPQIQARKMPTAQIN
jgi:hypothetical protein